MTVHARRPAALAAVLLVLALVAPAAAAPFQGGAVRYSGAQADENDLNAAVAYNPTSDQYLVVWQDARNHDTRGYDIWAQRVGANGARIGPNIRVSDGAALSSEYTPDVVFNVTSNQYLVVWADGRDDPAQGIEIYGQRIRAGGKLAGANFRISDSSAVGNEGAPAVAWNPNGNQYLVVWEDTRLDPGGPAWDIYGQRIRGSGQAAGVNFRISGPLGAPALDAEFSPDVAFSVTANKYLVVWSDHRDYGTRGGDIYGARVRPSGLIATADILISGIAADKDDSHPAVAWNTTTNQFLVVWDDGRNAPARGLDIYGRRIKAGGAMAGLDFRISDAYSLGYDTDPGVSYSSLSDKYMVVWSDTRDAATEGLNIYCQRVKSGGALPGYNLLVSGIPTDAQEIHPAVAFGSGAGLHLIVWQDSRNAGRGSDIYGRLASD